MPKNILDSDSSSDENDETTKSEPLKINENYAKVFNQYREKEEYQRLKAKYGEEVANDKLNEIEDSSSSEEEDDEAEQWTEEHETDFLKALANLKGKKAKTEVTEIFPCQFCMYLNGNFNTTISIFNLRWFFG